MSVFQKLHGVTGHGDLMFPSMKHPGEPISDGAWLDQDCARYMVGSRGKGEVSTATNHLGFRLVRSGQAR